MHLQPVGGKRPATAEEEKANKRPAFLHNESDEEDIDVFLEDALDALPEEVCSSIGVGVRASWLRPSPPTLDSATCAIGTRHQDISRLSIPTACVQTSSSLRWIM